MINKMIIKIALKSLSKGVQDRNVRRLECLPKQYTDIKGEASTSIYADRVDGK